MARIPAKIGNFPIHDPDGHYFGFAISGYGLMWNKNYLKAHKLPAPKEWTDLTNPRYYNHLVISAPSRSGTTHLTIETILQAYGWEKGWALLLNAGGNMGSITERSFGVPEAVISGQYGIGVVIDFFGLSAIASGHPIDFAYPSLTSALPPRDRAAARGPGALRQGAQGLPEPLHHEARGRGLRRQALLVPAQRRQLALRPPDHLPPRRAQGGLGRHLFGRRPGRQGQGGGQERGGRPGPARRGAEARVLGPARGDAGLGQGRPRPVPGQAPTQGAG